jgi:Flp pilus assembly protein TadG
MVGPGPKTIWARERKPCVCDEEGTALIETAISTSLLALLLMGIIQFGLMAFTEIEVSNAARAAAQYGAMSGGAFLSTDSTGMDSAGMLNAAQGDAGNLTSSPVTFATGYPTYTCICSSSSDTTASCTPPATPSGCSASHLIVTVKVRTQTTYTPLIRVPGFANSLTLYGNAQEEVLQ